MRIRAARAARSRGRKVMGMLLGVPIKSHAAPTLSI
jgi:hypothetical protein